MRKAERKTVAINIRVTPKMVVAFNRLAKKEGMYKTEFLRHLIKQAIKQEKEYKALMAAKAKKHVVAEVIKEG